MIDAAKFIDLRLKLRDLFERVNEGVLLERDLAKVDEVVLDGDPAWVEGMIDSKSVHDEDYLIFRKFEPGLGTILDVGANWGYSAGSIRATGCDLPIISFEIIPEYESCLKAVKKKLGVTFDYVVYGVGSDRSSLVLHIPVLNGRAVTALTTASVAQHNQWMENNLVDYARQYMSDAESYLPQFLKIKVEVDSLDSLLQRDSLTVSAERISAIKIDVEGLECDVLRGARNTLLMHRPMLLIEGGARNPTVHEELLHHGYSAAIRNVDSITVVKGLDVDTCNGIFVHPSMFASYRQQKLIQD